MQQIKVITVEEIDRSDTRAIFEEEVNGALAAGWEIAHLAAVKESVVALMTREVSKPMPDTPISAAPAGQTLAERLKWLRERSGLTLKVVSSISNISVSYLSDMERGRTPLPNVSVLFRLAPAYSVTPSALLHGVTLWGEVE